MTRKIDPEKMKKFEQMGGRVILERYSKVFYDKVYEHPWLGLYFKDIKQEIIEEQQVDFLQSSLGGGNVYLGKLPIPAHKHMNITEDLFELRNELVLESLKEVGASEELIEKIMKIDLAFKYGLVKKKLEDCEKRFFTDEIMDFPNPIKKAS